MAYRFFSDFIQDFFPFSLILFELYKSLFFQIPYGHGKFEDIFNFLLLSVLPSDMYLLFMCLYH